MATAKQIIAKKVATAAKAAAPIKKPAPAPTKAPAKAPAPATAKATAPVVGRYDKAGNYIGASSPLQLPSGGGMSAAMAAAIKKNPNAYPGYKDPSKGKPVYRY